MRVVLCLDGPDGAGFVAGALRTARLEGAEMTLLHVRDSGPRGLVELARGRPGRPPLRPERRRALDDADHQRADDLFATAAQVLARALPDGVPTRVLLEGRPEREIVRFLDEQRADLVILGGRPGVPPGPHSIGHVARFVLDHARCSVLLVR